eukprot:TRINITY_DN10043_c0_g1_i1.p1 TRINITY_DN10043_c0_g1~~TRINITY_DN10043_c0_g1_i1.p1  ORF type:complete len:152 (+),score=29.86 TRINITY_DN10043_c0_g1_i1:209-664(+)
MPPKKSKRTENAKATKKLKEDHESSSSTLWHNPKCSKSRETLKLLTDNNVQPTIYKYLEDPPSKEAICDILKKLGISPRDLLRTTEAVYKSGNLKSNEHTDNALVDAMVSDPILIQRPIFVANNEARIGRPPSQVLEIIDDSSSKSSSDSE